MTAISARTTKSYGIVRIMDSRREREFQKLNALIPYCHVVIIRP